MENGTIAYVRKYHVTHRQNLGRILVEGLRTEKDVRGTGRIWACDLDRLGWAIAHVCSNHDWDKSQMIVLAAELPFSYWIKQRPGIYWTKRDIPQEDIAFLFRHA